MNPENITIDGVLVNVGSGWVSVPESLWPATFTQFGMICQDNTVPDRPSLKLDPER